MSPHLCRNLHRPPSIPSHPSILGPPPIMEPPPIPMPRSIRQLPPSSLNSENIFNLLGSIMASGTNHVLTSTQQNLQDIKVVCTDLEFGKLTKLTYEKLCSLKSSNIDIVKTCPITLEDFGPKSIIIVLPCNHCIGIVGGTKWLKETSNKCPICRKKCSTGVPII